LDEPPLGDRRRLPRKAGLDQAADCFGFGLQPVLETKILNRL